MEVYIFLFFTIALSAFFIDKTRKLAWFGFIIFAVLYIFRARIGTDYPGYKAYYESMAGLKDLSVGGFEPGYNTVALVFHQLGLPFQVMCICMNSVVIVLFTKAIRRLRLAVGISLLAALYYFFYPTLETLRQEIAISLFLYSLTLDLDAPILPGMGDRKKQYFVLNFIGFLFHRTALIAFLYYFFRKKRAAKIAITAALIGFAALQPVILYLLKGFPSFYNRYYFYLWESSVNQEEGSFFSFKLLEYVIAFAALMIVNFRNNHHGKVLLKKIKRSDSSLSHLYSGDKSQNLKLADFVTILFDPQNYRLATIDNISLNLIEMGLVVMLFLTPIIHSMYRLMYYCDIGIVLFYASLPKKISNLYVKILYVAVLVIYIGLRLSRIFPFGNELFTYHFLI